MRRFALFAGFCVAAVLSALAPSAARVVIPAEKRIIPWHGQTPECGDPAVIEKIQRYFATREDHYWELGLRIEGIDKIQPIAWRPWGRDYIPRRYCVGRALLSDGRFRRVSYNIIESGGIIGMTWGVEWCVTGLDRLFYYAPDCKMARP